MIGDVYEWEGNYYFVTSEPFLDPNGLTCLKCKWLKFPQLEFVQTTKSFIPDRKLSKEEAFLMRMEQ